MVLIMVEGERSTHRALDQLVLVSEELKVRQRVSDLEDRPGGGVDGPGSGRWAAGSGP